MKIDLFTPLKLGPYELTNRIVMAPMTRCRTGTDRAPNELIKSYYAQRASAGLIISEACAISPRAVGYVNTPGIYNEGQIEGWRRVTEAVHEKGGHIFLQLWHVGRISHPALLPDGELPVAPSAVQPRGEVFTGDGLQPFVTPRALRTDEIPGIVADYRKAAANTLAAGFDGVEVHAANGYLIDQFLRSSTNRREDEYGGLPEHRVRFPLEVVRAVNDVWGPDRVGVRISPLNGFNDISDSDPQTLFDTLIDGLSPMGLAYLHVVEGAIHTPEPAGQTFDYKAAASRFLGLYMANNGYDQARAEAALAEGTADLVSFGVPFIANPDLPERFAQGAPLSKADQATFYEGGEKGYTDYPTMSGPSN